jgi:large subunit ribosomal protein L18
VRLAVYRSNNHIYAQVIAATGDRVLATASTLDEAIRTANPKTSTVAAASLVGKAIAEKAKGLGIEAVAFDRSGFRYHGRVKAVAEAAREAGLKF